MNRSDAPGRSAFPSNLESLSRWRPCAASACGLLIFLAQIFDAGSVKADSLDMTESSSSPPWFTGTLLSTRGRTIPGSYGRAAVCLPDTLRRTLQRQLAFAIGEHVPHHHSTDVFPLWADKPDGSRKLPLNGSRIVLRENQPPASGTFRFPSAFNSFATEKNGGSPIYDSGSKKSSP